jgi:hypothetical protein
MSLDMDSRKNRSSSTTETSSFFIMPPAAIRWTRRPSSELYRGSAWNCPAFSKNATSAMPVPHKLWLMSKRHEPSYRRPALWMPDVDLRFIEPVVTILSRPARPTAASRVSMRKLWCTPRIL